MPTLEPFGPAPVAHISDPWVIASFKEPLLLTRDDQEEETWVLNPPRRYIFNASTLSPIRDRIQTYSPLRNASRYKPLQAGMNLASARILVERHRDRGIGDLLFLTGPLNYLRHLSGHTAHIDIYGLAERAQILDFHPALAYKSALRGPLHYEDLDYYSAHWFIEAVTEEDQERDQLNVYDALYRQIGLDPTRVEPRFKRPSITLTEADGQRLDAIFFAVFQKTGLNLRNNGYYVVAPLAHSTLRMAPYNRWLEIIQELALHKPVVVIGQVIEGRMPTADTTFGAFYETLGTLGPNVVNLIGNTPLRAAVSLISNAQALVCLDSGPLYIAQALRTPAVSLWGTHHPGVRLGYDQTYMENAVWAHDACRHSPCYAYRGFPREKCPQGEGQRVCEVLAHAEVVAVMQRIETIERAGHLVGRNIV